MYTALATETFADVAHPSGKGYLYESEDEPKGKVQEPQLPPGYLKVTGFANRAIKRTWVLRKRFRVQYEICPQCELLFITRTVDRCQCKVQKHG